MKDIDKLVYIAGEYYTYFKRYVDTKFELFKLALIEKSSRAVASMAYRSIFVIVGALFIIFTSLSAAFYLSLVCESQAMGFGLVAAAYALLAILLILLRKPVKRLIMNSVVGDISNAIDYDEERFEKRQV